MLPQNLASPMPQSVRRPAFDFTAHMRLVCSDMILRLEELRHIDLARVAVSFAQARKRVTHGLFASLTPLRFAGGQETTVRRGRCYHVQKLYNSSGREMFYVLTFYLPRFMDLDFREKLITIVHELWHISPQFDGDIRRHEGRCFAHTGSQKQYDAQMDLLAQRWLSLGPPEELWGFLAGGFDDLAGRHGRIVGVKIPRPKLILAK